MKKQHGNTGKKNAMKAESPAIARLNIRVTEEQKAQFKKQAADSGMNLSEWLISIAEAQ